MQETCDLIGRRIHRARQAAGLSLRELADQVGISHTQIANFEKGKTTPDSRDLLQIAETVGMRFEWFLRPVQRELKEVSFRKRKRLPRKDQEAIQAHVLDHFARRLEVESLFPKPPIRNFESPAKLPRKLSSLDQVEAVANELPQQWPADTMVEEPLISHAVQPTLMTRATRLSVDSTRLSTPQIDAGMADGMPTSSSYKNAPSA